MTPDDDYLLHPHHDELQMEFADLFHMIETAMGGDAPAPIGDKIDGIANGVIAYQEALLAAIQRRDEEIAALRRKDGQKSEQAEPDSIEVTEFQVDCMLHKISESLADLINLLDPPQDKREEVESLSFWILNEVQNLKDQFHEKDEDA